MKPRDILNRFLKGTSQHAPAQVKPRMQSTGHESAMTTTILQAVERTLDVELSCDDVHALLDQFAEMVNHGEDASKAMPMLQHHIDMCPDCREEFEALMRILKANPAI